MKTQIYILPRCKVNQLKSILSVFDICQTVFALLAQYHHASQNFICFLPLSSSNKAFSHIGREAPSIAGTLKRPPANSVCQMMRTLNNTGEQFSKVTTLQEGSNAVCCTLYSGLVLAEKTRPSVCSTFVFYSNLRCLKDRMNLVDKDDGVFEKDI